MTGHPTTLPATGRLRVGIHLADAYLRESWWLNAVALIAVTTRAQHLANPRGDLLKVGVLHALLIRVRRLRGVVNVRGFDHRCSFVGTPIGADNMSCFCAFLALLTGCAIEECIACDPMAALVLLVVEGSPMLAARLLFFLIMSITGAFFAVFQVLSSVYGREFRVGATLWVMRHRGATGACVVSVSFGIGLAIGKIIVLSLT
tara:strand:- start:3343 stop:3951 length:609 start_codon:yes stop_codon:yes gene_type:complete